MHKKNKHPITVKTMLKNPLVSFVVTSYNYEKYLLKTLESIAAQTYKDYEIIIVDDASDDNSVEIAERFIRNNQDKRITLLRNEKNLGQLGSMMKGLKNARGEFVSFIDSDDMLLPDYAKAHIKVHMVTSVAFTSSEIIEINENDEIITTYSVSSPHKSTHFELKNFEDLLKIDVEHPEFKLLNQKTAPFGGWFWSPNSSAMFRKSAIEMLLNYTNIQNWKICPDKFLFNIANLIGGSAIIFEPLVAYRRHCENAGFTNSVCGNKRYNNDKTTAINIENNIKIRPETIRFIFENRKYFYKKFGKRNTAKFIIEILTSYFYVLKQCFK